MKKYLIVLYKILIALFIAIVTWFGIGPVLLNTPSTIIYYGGVLLNVLVIIPVAYMLKSAYKTLNKEEK